MIAGVEESAVKHFSMPYITLEDAIRGAATGFCFNAGRIITAIAVLFVGIVVTELGGYGSSLFIFFSTTRNI